MAKGNSEHFRSVLRTWMRAVVRAVESTSQGSVRAVHRHFGQHHKVGPEAALNKTQQTLSRYDGGDEVEDMALELARSSQQPSQTQRHLIEEAEGTWQRPQLPMTDVPVKAS
eukprot:4248324-Karenia_brevis.AAC.1